MRQITDFLSFPMQLVCLLIIIIIIIFIVVVVVVVHGTFLA